MKKAITRYLITLLLLTGCQQEQRFSTPVYTVTPSDFSIQVNGFGEIEATLSQKIYTPGQRRMTLAWLEQENTYVEKGDVIARFDSQIIQKDSREEEIDLRKLDQDLLKNTALQREQKQQIASDQTLVDYEFEFVDKFAIDDLRIYSQLEIIDTFADRDFLEAKDSFLQWQKSSIDEQHISQTAVLDIRKSGVAQKHAQLQAALSNLDVVSPYSGLLVFEKDQRGEKPTVGKTIYPGRVIARIPNLENMQAKVYVQAKDALDLAAGQSVDISLQAFPEHSFSGEVTQVSGYPRSIERRNPITYFELTVALLKQDLNKMQPGRKLRAKINVKAPSKTLVVPLQALHHENGQTYVYVQHGRQFTKRQVSSGKKNLYLVEISTGLVAGDVIALSIPTPSELKDS